MNREEWGLEEEREFISELRDKYPEQFLRTILIHINDDIHQIGLFKCMKCNKPITDEQFNFARVCGDCDTPHQGGFGPKWTIERPTDKVGGGVETLET